MSRLSLFVLSSFLGGLGGLLGSIVGNFFGKPGLWIGGVVGGLVGAAGAVAVAKGRAWIAAEQFPATSIGAMVGFLAAAAVAVNTLSSPVGPILSSGLTGLGAVIGARLSAQT